ncbi:hypothetical protein UlMin_033362 [Ulmus minor]
MEEWNKINLEDEEEEKREIQAIQRKELEKTCTFSWMLEDPKVFKCTVCLDTNLSSPIYLCEKNEHIVCKWCNVACRDICPSCSSFSKLVRCPLMERISESVSAPCENMEYGCKQTLGLVEKIAHEKICSFAPCSLCPFNGCDNFGPIKKLNLHIKNVHNNSVIHFEYNSPFSAILDTSKTFCVLQEENCGDIFIIQYSKDSQNSTHIVTLKQIWPYSSERKLFYELEVSFENSSLILKSQVLSRVRGEPLKFYQTPRDVSLIVPRGICRSYPAIDLDILIWDEGLFTS